MKKMNEISILMHLLGRRKDKIIIGATKNEILDKLNLRSKNKNIHFQRLITGLSHYLKPVGLLVKFNPLNDHWYLIYESEISDLISAQPFEGRPSLAATLLCVIICGIKASGIAKIEDIKKLRKKKNVLQDLKDLAKRGYLTINKGSSEILLTPLVGYHLDLYKLFMKIALKTKEEDY
jgi:hypothetical protein